MYVMIVVMSDGVMMEELMRIEDGDEHLPVATSVAC